MSCAGWVCATVKSPHQLTAATEVSIISVAVATSLDLMTFPSSASVIVAPRANGAPSLAAHWIVTFAAPSRTLHSLLSPVGPGVFDPDQGGEGRFLGLIIRSHDAVGDGVG